MFMCEMTHSYLLIPMSMRDLTHSCKWHDSCACATWLIHTGDMPHNVTHTTQRPMSDLPHSHTCDTTIHIFMHDPFKYVTRPIYRRNAHHTKIHVLRDSLVCATRLMQICDMTHSYTWHATQRNTHHAETYVWHASFTYMWHNSFIFLARPDQIVNMADS